MFIFPKLIEEKNSKFNGTIQVYKLLGKYSISVDNLTQSGGLLVPIWKKALKKILNTKYDIRNTLILGLGGGTAVQLISQYWPNAKITAIEIDPVMVKLAKKYHAIDRLRNLKIVIGDAFKLITSRYTLVASRYDLILVDTYQGKTYPHQAKSKPFITQLKKLLSPQGFVIFNRLNWEKNDQDIARHISLLKDHFSQVDSRKIISNTLVFCRSSE